MRSSTIAAIITAALVGTAKLLSIPALQFDDRQASRIWETDIVSPLRARLRNELGTLCLPKFDAITCSTGLDTEIVRASAATRAEFERCANDSWFKWRCTSTAQQALQDISAQSIMVSIEKADTDRQAAAATAAAARNHQAAQKARKVELEAERAMAAQIMGTDEGYSYLLRAYDRRIVAAERECRARAGLGDLTELLIQSTRQFDPVGKICQAAVRKKPFAIRPYGQPIMIGYPLPPFSQIWQPGKCIDQGQQAWRCMQQAAEAIASRAAYWGELDHEINVVLRSLTEQQRQLVPSLASRPYR